MGHFSKLMIERYNNCLTNALAGHWGLDYYELVGQNFKIIPELNHDGTGSISIAFTPVRIVCANTLNAALRHNSNCIKIRHTASAADKLKQAQKMLGLSTVFRLKWRLFTTGGHMFVSVTLN